MSYLLEYAMEIVKNFVGYRFFLAFFVVICHVYNYEGIGDFAVNAFFLLQGFLVGTKYPIAIDKRTNLSKYALKNIINSLAKIYPVYLMMTLVFFLLHLFALHKGIEEMLYSLGAHIFLIQNMWHEKFVESLNTPTWFLSAYYFNLLMFLCATNLSNKYGSKSVFMLFTTYSIFYFFIIFTTGLYNNYTCYFFAMLRFIDFLFGYILSVYVSKIKKCGFEINYTINLLLLLCVVSYGILFYLKSIYELPSFVSRDFIYLIPSSILMILLFSCDKKKTFITKWLSCDLIQFLGNLSIGIYMYHFIFVRVFFYLYPNMNKLFELVIVVLASIIISYYSQKLFENKIYYIIKRHI